MTFLLQRIMTKLKSESRMPPFTDTYMHHYPLHGWPEYVFPASIFTPICGCVWQMVIYVVYVRVRIRHLKYSSAWPIIHLLVVCYLSYWQKNKMARILCRQHFNGINLTHWGQDKMDAIFQTTFSNGFSWMKMYEFQLKFHWSLFLGVQLAISQYWFR